MLGFDKFLKYRMISNSLRCGAGRGNSERRLVTGNLNCQTVFFRKIADIWHRMKTEQRETRTFSLRNKSGPMLLHCSIEAELINKTRIVTG